MSADRVEFRQVVTLSGLRGREAVIWWALLLAVVIGLGLALLIVFKAWRAVVLGVAAVIPLSYGVFLLALVSDCYGEGCAEPPALPWIAVGVAGIVGSWVLGVNDIARRRRNRNATSARR